jgi:hypothetical protein
LALGRVNLFISLDDVAILTDGRTALETIFDETDTRNLSTELDVYWLTKVGENPVKWWMFEQDESRCTTFESIQMSVEYL